MKEPTRKRKINIDEMTDGQLKAYLNKTIDDEIDQPPNRQNIDLVRECVDFIMDIDDAEKSLTAEDIRRETQNILQKYNNSRHKTLKRGIKKTISAAVCIILILSALNLIAFAFGYNPLNILKQWGSRILDMPGNSIFVKDEITFFKSNIKHQYDSVSDLISGENLNIAYPGYLPDGILLNRIDCIETGDFFTYIFVFSKNTLSFEISGQYPDDIIENLEKSGEIYQINDITFYILSLDDKSRQAVFIFNDMLYTIRYDDYSRLIKITENIKK